jgi:hypothetical protein
VSGRIEPPAALGQRQPAHQLVDCAALALHTEAPTEQRVVERVRSLGHRGDDRHQPRSQLGEHGADERGRHPGLVVVEQRVVRMVERLETGRVAAPQLDVPLQVREQGGEVGVRPRGEPGRLPDRRRPSELGAQLDRHPPGPLALAPSRPDRVGTDGAGLHLRLAEALDQLPQPVVDQALMADPGERPDLLRPSRRAAGGHHRPLVPGQQRFGAVEVRDLGEAVEQLVELGRPGIDAHGWDLARSGGRPGPRLPLWVRWKPPSNHRKPISSRSRGAARCARSAIAA